jgi:hypothetical protein
MIDQDNQADAYGFQGAGNTLQPVVTPPPADLEDRVIALEATVARLIAHLDPAGTSRAVRGDDL